VNAQDQDAAGSRDPFRRGLAGFYVSCTAVGLFAAVAAVAWIVFPHVGGASAVATVACVLAVVAAVLTWYFLGVSRRER
jgi:hypothetical protein